MNPSTRKLLRELTSLPTASGREGQVIAYVEQWASRRPNVRMKRDRHGNVMLQRHGAKSADPLVFEAHMDHPAFVVQRVEGCEVIGSFRGGVKREFFEGSAVRLNSAKGKIVRLMNPDQPMPAMREAGGDLLAVARFPKQVNAKPGDVMTWALDKSRIKAGRLHAPACDNLAGVAAALAAFDALLEPKSFRGDVRVLLTRAEEIGFIGAMAACRSRIIPRRARLIVLENSKSFPDSPIGAGPIVRVGDRTSTFDPDLTYRLSRIMEDLPHEDNHSPDSRRFRGFRGFRGGQRKLMAGGTCEASAFQAFGYVAACVCLPLGNYHNMNERTGRIDHEQIAVSDFENLITLLVAAALRIDQPGAVPPLRDRLQTLFAQRKSVLDE